MRTNILQLKMRTRSGRESARRETHVKPKPEHSGAKALGVRSACRLAKDEQGMAMVLCMIALSMLAAFSAYLCLSSVEELRISDNSESMSQARFAASAGIDHAREILRGLSLNATLKGPDGTYSTASGYLNTARSASFRNLTDWATLRSLNISDPTNDVSSLADDGLISTGGASATVLVPKTGIAFTAANPYRSGTLTTARYFLKVTDNNGEASELAGDAGNNPFVDGDGTIIVRSIGVARTITERAGNSTRRNSVAIFESRLQQGNPFAELGSPAVVIGSNINARFAGNAFDIIGNSSGPGLATVDTDLTDAFQPDAIIRNATGGKGNISGNCPPPNDQCIADITASVMIDPLKSRMRDPAYLYDLVFTQMPSVADYVINGNGATVMLNSGNVGTPANPKITYINGDCIGTGSIHGAGLLVVTGNLELGGAIIWDGLVLVLGKGEFLTHGMNNGIFGGLVVAGIKLDAWGRAIFTPASTDFDIRGNSNISTYDGSLATTGNNLMPLRQLSFREITNGMDP
jgi:hypothetical protein